MPKKAKFSVEDEEKIINFVKTNEILYNMKHKRFRDSKAKNRLWSQIAKELNMNGEVVKKKWQTMRDYFVRSKEKKKSSRATRSSKRDKSLLFLYQSTNSNKYPNSPFAKDTNFETNSDADGSDSPASTSESPKPEKRSVSPMSGSDTNEIVEKFSDQRPKSSDCSPQKTSDDIQQILVEKEITWDQKEASVEDIYSLRHISSISELDTKENLREFMIQRPKPPDFMAEKPNDDIQKFFDSMASTVRKFSPVTIARIKLKIARLVGENEIAWAEHEAAVEKIFLCDNLT